MRSWNMRFGVGRLLQWFWSGLTGLARALGLLVRNLFGLSWQAPWWLRQMGNGLRWTTQWLRTQGKARPLASSVIAAALVALLGAGGYGWYWYQNQPKPRTVGFNWTPPPVTVYREEPPIVQPLGVRFKESAAPLAAIGKEIGTGIQIEPVIAGEWRWSSDRQLNFMPDGDWPISRHFRVVMNKKGLLADGVVLSDYTFEFSSAPFEARITQPALYQDPVNPQLKQAIATVEFSHPVDEASLRSRASVNLGPGLTYLETGKNGSQPDSKSAQKVAPETDFEKNGLKAYLRSSPLAMPLDSTTATIEIDQGVKPRADASAVTQQRLSTQVSVPGRYQLSFNGTRIEFAENERGESEPVLMFNASSPIADKAIESKVHAWLLPAREEDKAQWNAQDVDEATLASAERVPLAHVPGEQVASTLHAFKFLAKPGRDLFVKIDAGVEATGGYLVRNPTYSVLRMPDYPRALSFLSDGALIPLGGERKLGYMARGVSGVHVEIARLLPGELHHLVDQSTGTLARPNLQERYFDRLTERESRDVALAASDPSKTQYDFVDLARYLRHDGGRRGLFLVRLSETRKTDQDDSSDRDDGPSDLRFVAVTDLGLIAKHSANGGHDVYVQSIASGTPVAGASVRVVGRNGLPVAESTSDEQGHVRFEGLDDLTRERKPLMYVVSLGSDLSFLPIAQAERKLDFSRFDVGGISQLDDDADGLHAYIFSDRGLYRPGETAHLGMIVRRGDWRGGIQGLPVEFDVLDPRGVQVMRRTLKVPASGFDSIDFASAASAPAGTYQVQLSLVGKNNKRTLLGSASFSVRDFEPDRMKVSLSLAPQAVRGWINPAQVNAQVSAEHLFGASASDRRVTAQMVLSPAFAEFAGYESYRFQLRDGLMQPSQEDLAEKKTDPDGKATLDLGLNRFADSTYKLQVLTRVFEAEGGRSVAAEDSVLVSSAKYLVGVKSQDSLSFVPRGSVRRVRWQAVTSDLLPLAVDSLRLKLVERRHVSVLVRQPNGTYKYESRRKDIEQEPMPLELPANGAEVALDTANPGDFSLVLEDADGKRLNQIDYSVAGQGNVARALDRSAELQLRLDKRSYKPGDDIAVSIRAPYAGAGLLTIERDKVYAQQWFKTDGTSSVQHIKLPQALEGNAYINVQFVRDPGSSEVYMSPLSYGVAPFSIDRDARKLAVSLSAPEKIEPGQALAIKVKSARPSRAVVFAVDEGILQVARYNGPDPLGYFFRKRALDVDTSQILDLILPEFSQLLKASAPGGDSGAELASHLNPFKRKGKPPVAWWSGMVDLPAGETTLNYNVPDYFNGKLRLYAVAVDDTGMGLASGQADVRGPLVITPNVPAFVAPGDEFIVTAGIFSNLPNTARVRYRLETGGGLAVAQPEGELELQPSREGTVNFRVRAGDHLGSADLRWIAELPGGRQVRIAETVSVRPASAHRVQLTLGSFSGSRQEVALTRELHSQMRDVRLSLDASPLAWASGLGSYLEENGNVCTEQMLSRTMPALIQGMDKAVAQKAVDGILQVLRQRQTERGAFGLWGASLVVVPEVSLYAVDFMLEARERGYAIGDDVLERANAYLSALSGGPASGLGELRDRAYAAYLLTRQGVIVSADLADIQEQLQTDFESSWRSDLAAVYLAASYKLLKKEQVADKLFAATAWRSTKAEWFSDGPYYDALVHDAQRLALAARYFPATLKQVPPQLLERIGKSLSERRYNSFSAALLVRGLDAYGKQMGSRMELSALTNISAANTNGGQAKQTQALAFTGKPPQTPVPPGARSLDLSKRGDGPAFYMLSESGFDRSPAKDASSAGLEIVREYLDLKEQPISKVKVGDEFFVRLRMRTIDRDAAHQVAVVDLLPGGLEPVLHVLPDNAEESGDGGEGNDVYADGEEDGSTTWQPPLGEAGRSDWHPEFADVRDDRVVFYGDLQRNASTFIYRVRATNAGTFATPPAYAEGMYDTRLQAQGAAGRLEIVEP